MAFLYQIFTALLVFGFRVGATFNRKIKLGYRGRAQSYKIVKSQFSAQDRVIWMHAASLGEYEQGLPVLEQLKEQFPKHKILITFFSPSGYEIIIKKKHIADAICYLPFDTRKGMKRFVNAFNTDIFFTVKYDYWYHLFQELKRKGAKIYVVSALFYDKQIFFKSYGKWFVNQLDRNVDWFFHQTENSYQLAKNIGLENASVAGDTRFDRVKKIRERNNEVAMISDFKNAEKLLVFGSSWEAEERIAKIISEENPTLKIILAPHDLDRVKPLQQLFPNALLYSQLSSQSKSQSKSQPLIIDSIGLLSKIYSYADLAVVGGGFHSAGLHNILEAATFGIPVFFGNQYKKNPEADALIAQNGGKSFADETQTTTFISSLLKDEPQLKIMARNAGEFVHTQPNSSEVILRKILENKS